MKKIKHPALKSVRSVYMVLVVLFGLLAVIGTGNDDGGTITIYNWDDHDYYVELRSTDDELIDTLNVHDFPGFDTTDSFTDVDEGDYYIIIYRNDVEQDRTSSFHLDDDEYECFKIDDDGEIDDC